MPVTSPSSVPVVLVDDHHAILSRDEQAVIRRIRHDVVPAAVAAERVGVRDAVGARRLGQQRGDQRQREHQPERAHHGLLRGWSVADFV